MNFCLKVGADAIVVLHIGPIKCQLSLNRIYVEGKAFQN